MIMELKVITLQEVNLRTQWVEEINRLSGDFGDDSSKVEEQISEEVNRNGIAPLLGHLRLCGAIPESYRHDSTEEKLYSKYTDVVIHEAYTAMGLTSLVLRERADVADVECVADDYSFVADAKAFRLSRTAKNQKDFKVQAMDNWKHGKPFAMVVCPVYQLPSRNSQIYHQAGSRSVCILTYTHLAVLVRYANAIGQSNNAIGLLHSVFKAVEAINPSKDATAYWRIVNRTFLDADGDITDIWMEEKMASTESISVAREEALTFLARERECIMRLSRAEAIGEVLRWRNIANRAQVVESVRENGLLGVL